MVTGASTADAAILLVDARKGLLTQTRRHSYLVSLIGIRHVALAVNKMDLVGLLAGALPRDRGGSTEPSPGRSEPATSRAFRCRRSRATTSSTPSSHMPWYRGPTLIGWLETVEVDDARLQHAAVSPAGPVGQPPEPGFSRLRGHDRERHDPARRPGSRCSLRDAKAAWRASSPRGGDLEQAVDRAVDHAHAGRRDRRDSRGDLIVAADAPAEVADQFEATIVWMGEQPMLRGRTYAMKIGAKTVAATIAPLKYRVNVNTLEHLAAEKLELNEIGVCELELDQPDRLRPLRREPRDRRLHPDRPPDQPHRGRRDAAASRCGARRTSTSSTSTSTRPRAPRLKGQQPVRGLAHRALGRGQVHDRQPGGEEAPRHGPPHLHPRRRQRAPRTRPRTSASPTRIAWRTSAASPRWRS